MGIVEIAKLVVIVAIFAMAALLIAWGLKELRK